MTKIIVRYPETDLCDLLETRNATVMPISLIKFNELAEDPEVGICATPNEFAGCVRNAVRVIDDREVDKDSMESGKAGNRTKLYVNTHHPERAMIQVVNMVAIQEKMMVLLERREDRLEILRNQMVETNPATKGYLYLTPQLAVDPTDLEVVDVAVKDDEEATENAEKEKE